MRIIKYTARYKGVDREIGLVKESSREYEGLNMSDPLGVTQAMVRLYHTDVLPEEHTWLIGLDQKLGCRGVCEISKGSVAQSMVPIREIMRNLLLMDAVRFIFIHNHPAQSLEPSGEDRQVTKRLREAANVLGIDMLDHIILGNGYYSFKEHGFFQEDNDD